MPVPVASPFTPKPVVERPHTPYSDDVPNTPALLLDCPKTPALLTDSPKTPAAEFEKP
jgi:hypothetical protein